MFKNMKLSAKLIGSFIIVATITVAVGAIGWRGARSLATRLQDIGLVRLPAVDRIHVITENLERIKTAQRSLLDQHMVAADRQRQHDNVTAARTAYKQAFEEYSALPQTPELKAKWDEFVKSVDAWKTENDKFFALSDEFDAAKIANPGEMDTLYARMKGDHCALAMRLYGLVHNSIQFEGGDDDAACTYGKWTSSNKAENPVIAKAVSDSLSTHRRLHADVRRIKEA